jgi:hypothetical protein
MIQKAWNFPHLPMYLVYIIHIISSQMRTDENGGCVDFAPAVTCAVLVE